MRKIKLQQRDLTVSTKAKFIRIWKKYAKKLTAEAIEQIRKGAKEVKGLKFSKKELEELEILINLSFKEINRRSADFMLKKLTKVDEKKYTLPSVDISAFRNDKKIYSVFEKRRDDQIAYFKKFPKYVELKTNEHLKKAVEELENSKKEVTFDALKVQKSFAKVPGITERHASFIARDQLGKFLGAINDAQNEKVGCKCYIWRTVKDNRVRTEHHLREGKVFYYANPPADGNPGEPVRCRCSAEAVLFLKKKAAA